MFLFSTYFVHCFLLKIFRSTFKSLRDVQEYNKVNDKSDSIPQPCLYMITEKANGDLTEAILDLSE